MEIRPYAEKDKDAVIQLWTDCGLVVPSNNPQRDIERKLKVNPEWFLVGERAGKVIASCLVGYEGHRGWINYLAVTPQEQRKGIAKELMKAAEMLLKSVDCPKINLQVRAGNAGVIAFYERIGFKVEDIISLGKRLEIDEKVEKEKGSE